MLSLELLYMNIPGAFACGYTTPRAISRPRFIVDNNQTARRIYEGGTNNGIILFSRNKGMVNIFRALASRVLAFSPASTVAAAARDVESPSLFA
jgi:hypothetical protein